MTEKGPIYGVELIDTIPLNDGPMLQAMPSQYELERVAEISERTVAGYEVLLAHYRKLKAFAESFLSPEENGMAVSAYIRDEARVVLGMKRVESSRR